MEVLIGIRVIRQGSRISETLSIGDLVISDRGFESLRRFATNPAHESFFIIELVDRSEELKTVLEIIFDETGKLPQRDPLHWRTDEFVIEKRKVFIKADVEKSKLLHLKPSNQCLELKFTEQRADESIDLPQQKKLERLTIAADAFAGGPFVLADNAVSAIRSAGLAGFSSLLVTIDGEAPDPPLYRFHSDVILPRCSHPLVTADRTTNVAGEIESVPFRGDYSRGCQLGIFLAMFDGWQLSYRASEIEKAGHFDIAVTTERIGNSESTAFRYLVVSQAFREFAKARGWRWCRFVPVEITED